MRSNALSHPAQLGGCQPGWRVCTCEQRLLPDEAYSAAHAVSETNGAVARVTMLSTIAIVLVVLWLLGIVSSTTIGGFVHVLLVVAIVIVLLRVIQGRRLLGGS